MPLEPPDPAPVPTPSSESADKVGMLLDDVVLSLSDPLLARLEDEEPLFKLLEGLVLLDAVPAEDVDESEVRTVVGECVNDDDRESLLPDVAEVVPTWEPPRVVEVLCPLPCSGPGKKKSNPCRPKPWRRRCPCLVVGTMPAREWARSSVRSKRSVMWAMAPRPLSERRSRRDYPRGHCPWPAGKNLPPRRWASRPAGDLTRMTGRTGRRSWGSGGPGARMMTGPAIPPTGPPGVRVRR